MATTNFADETNVSITWPTQQPNAGYGGAMIVDEGHTNAVHPETQRLGIARRLMLAVHMDTLEHHITAAEVNVSNERPKPVPTI